MVKRHTTLGALNRVHEGAVLGGEPQDLSFRDQETGLLIGDRNVIREGVTIHRSTQEGGTTVVGSDCFLMAYVHVAHDNRIGDRAILANNVMLAGHVELGERAFLGGGAGVHQFCRVGRLAMVGGDAKVVQDCLPFVITDGHPARARGLNVVGLRRAGVAASQLRALEEAYRLLVRSGLPLRAGAREDGRAPGPARRRDGRVRARLEARLRPRPPRRVRRGLRRPSPESATQPLTVRAARGCRNLIRRRLSPEGADPPC